MLTDPKFLSTPSARRATSKATFRARPSRNFYPRPPRGGRLVPIPISGIEEEFLSTPSARRATSRAARLRARNPISIHALREEGDPKYHEKQYNRSDFYPRPPRGGRPPSCSPKGSPLHFYPRPPRGGRPGPQEKGALNGLISIHALREEGDASRAPEHHDTGNFYPRPPRGGRPFVLFNCL